MSSGTQTTEEASNEREAEYTARYLRGFHAVISCVSETTRRVGERDTAQTRSADSACCGAALPHAIDADADVSTGLL